MDTLDIMSAIGGVELVIGAAAWIAVGVMGAVCSRQRLREQREQEKYREMLELHRNEPFRFYIGNYPIIRNNYIGEYI